MAKKKVSEGKTLAEVFGEESNPLSRVKLTDIDSITLENSDDTLVIKVMLPVDDGTFSEYEETISLDDHAPEGLHWLARKFSEAALRALKERTMKQAPVPCQTCTGACCYKYDEVRLTSEDVHNLSLLGKKGEDGFRLYALGPRWTGYVGALKKKPLTLNGQTIETACHFLRKDGCSIYEHRPAVCREYSPWTCGDTYEADPAKVDGKVRLRVLP